MNTLTLIKSITIKVFIFSILFIILPLFSSAQPSVTKAYQDALREFTQKKYGQTQKILNYIFRTDREFADAYFLQGQLHEAQHDDRAAIESYKSFNHYNNRDPKGLIKITEIYSKHNYVHLALQFLEEGLTKYPTNATILYTKASYLYENGSLDSAYQYLTRCIESDYNFDKAYNDRGVILHCQGKDELATPDFVKAILINPQPNYYLNQGVNFYMLGQYSKAIDAYNQALRLNKNAYTYNLRGVIYMEQGNYVQATADFLSAIEIDPEYSYPYNNLANVLAVQKDYIKSLSLYNTAIALDDETPEIYFNRGNVKELTDEHIEEACKDWERAVSLGMPRVVNYCP